MSVQMTSPNNEISEGISNGAFAAFVAVGRAFGEDVPAWNGAQDGQKYTPEQLTKIADRVMQLAELTPILHDLAANGGCKIS